MQRWIDTVKSDLQNCASGLRLEESFKMNKDGKK